MKTNRFINWQRMLLLAISPLLLMGVILLIGLVIGAIQYSPDYFTDVYVQQYRTPGSLLGELEQVIRQGDASKVAELQGVRWSPGKVASIPKFQFSMFWDADEKYQNYLFFDTSNYHRYPIHIKMVNGRYVWVPETLYYFVDSGRWVRTFFPILAVWWVALSLYIVTRWVYHILADFKPEQIVR
jgi:hypothetical protein